MVHIPLTHSYIFVFNPKTSFTSKFIGELCLQIPLLTQCQLGTFHSFGFHRALVILTSWFLRQNTHQAHLLVVLTAGTSLCTIIRVHVDMVTTTTWKAVAREPWLMLMPSPVLILHSPIPVPVSFLDTSFNIYLLI